jgi:elongation factor G
MSDLPPRLIEVAVEPKSAADQRRMGEALVRLAAEDSGFSFEVESQSGQTIIKGFSETHLEVVAERLKHEFKVKANIGAPQVAYRETISRAADVDYTHKKLTGASGEYARVKVRFEPLPRGSGYRFENAVIGGTVPTAYIPGVEKGLKDSLKTGVLAGFPVMDFSATLYDGAYHDVDSSALAFETAARGAFKEGMQKAGPKLLEPVMRVEVVTQRDHLPSVLDDLKKRRAEIADRSPTDRDARVITALIPLANLFGYNRSLRLLSQGHATCSIEFSHYAPVPPTDPDPPFRPAVGMRA